MRKTGLQFVSALASLLLAGSLCTAAFAQRRDAQNRMGRQRPPQETPRPRGPGKAERGEGRGVPRGLMGLPPRWIERLREMPPEEQERFLANNERFKSLPPQRQAQIRRHLQQWNSLTSEQRQAVREREQVWERMTPEQQRYVREDLLPRWQQMPQERRLAIVQHLRALRGLSEAERNARLNDDRFLEDLSPGEQNMLRELVNLRVGATPEPPPGNPPE